MYSIDLIQSWSISPTKYTSLTGHFKKTWRNRRMRKSRSGTPVCDVKYCKRLPIRPLWIISNGDTSLSSIILAIFSRHSTPQSSYRKKNIKPLENLYQQNLFCTVCILMLHVKPVTCYKDTFPYQNEYIKTVSVHSHMLDNCNDNHRAHRQINPF